MRYFGRVLGAGLAVIAMVVAMAVAGGSVASAQTAAAACSSPSHSANGEGYGILYGTHSARTGPYNDCTAIVNLSGGTKVWLWCSYENAYHNIWWWARVADSSISGWIYQGNMNIYSYDDDGDGSFEPRAC